jgi:hypothetical protein
MPQVTGFKITAELTTLGGETLWSGSADLGDPQGLGWVQPAAIAGTIAELANRVADALREAETGEESPPRTGAEYESPE